jgi:hypothetical protein
LAYNGAIFYAVSGAANRNRRAAINESILNAGSFTGAVGSGYLLETQPMGFVWPPSRRSSARRRFCRCGVVRYFFAAAKYSPRLLPVHHRPERLDVVRPTILVVQIVGVLPYVEADDRV